jgi:hypothetical protein
MARIRPLAVIAALSALVLGGAVPASAAGDDNFTCSGNFAFIPAGNYGSLTIEGFCLVVPTGNVNVTHNVVVAPGAVLLTNYPPFPPLGLPGIANISVGGNVIVQSGAVLLMGICKPPSFVVCTRTVISGNLIGDGALGIISHATTIGGSALESGGGNGGNCNPPTTGFFGLIHHPGFSVYDGDNIGRDVVVDSYRSCYLGVNHDHVGGNVVLTNNFLADPDAIEILNNTITGNLVCQQNSMVWDSAESTEMGLFPRTPEPNTVDGHRVGQCVTASPPGSGPF